MPGRRRTGSSPSRTSMSFAVYPLEDEGAESKRSGVLAMPSVANRACGERVLAKPKPSQTARPAAQGGAHSGFWGAVRHGGNDLIADDIVAQIKPDALRVIPGREHAGEIEFGDHDQQLPAISVRQIGVVAARARFDVGEMPGIGVITIAIDFGEGVAAKPCGFGRHT